MPTTTEVLAILNDVKYQDFFFRVQAILGGHILYIEREEIDHVSGEPKLMQGRRFYIHANMSKSDLVRTCFVAVLTWQEHEIREAFSYKGAAIFDPHFDVAEAVARARRYNLKEGG